MRLSCLLLICLLPYGCSFHKSVQDQAESVADDARKLLDSPYLRRQERASNGRRVLTNPRQIWLEAAWRGNYSKIPARQAIAAVAGDRSVIYSPGIVAIADDAQPLVSSVANATTVRQHLRDIAQQANWHFEVEGDEALFFNDIQTRVFRIAVPGVDRTAQIGRNAGEDGQLVGHRLDATPWDDLEKSLGAVLEEGDFAMLPAAGSIMVNATPDRVRRAAKIIDKFNKASRQRVLVEIELFLVDLSESQSKNLDWQFIREAANGNRLQLSRVGGADFGSGIPFTLQLEGLATGRYTGSEVLFHALSEQGSASVISSPRLICLNNQVSELRINRITPYTRSLKLTERNTGNTTILTPEVETAEVSGGISIYLLPSIQGDRVNILLSANYSQVTRFIEQSFGSGAVGGINLRLPEYDDTQFTLPVSLSSGETMVLAGNPRTVTNTEDSRSVLLPFLGSTSAGKRRFETVMLLTAHILDPS